MLRFLIGASGCPASSATTQFFDSSQKQILEPSGRISLGEKSLTSEFLKADSRATSVTLQLFNHQSSVRPCGSGVPSETPLWNTRHVSVKIRFLEDDMFMHKRGQFRDPLVVRRCSFPRPKLTASITESLSFSLTSSTFFWSLHNNALV